MARTSARTLELLSLLQTADRWGGPELAARLGVSLRTLRRDIETLRGLGTPVVSSGGRHATYRLAPGAVLPPLRLDGEQAVAISLALQTAPVSVLGLRDAADRALGTLAQVMPPELRAQVDATRVTTVRNYWDFSDAPIDPDVVAAVGDAVRRGHLLRAEVLRPDRSRPAPGEPDFEPPRRLEPHHLVLWAGRWYVVAFDLGAADWVIHRVDRLHPLMPTGVPFERRPLPATDVGEYVRSHPDRGDTPAHWQCLGSAVLSLPAGVVGMWAPGGSVVEDLGRDRCRLVLGAWSWAGIAGILATFDCEVSQVEPVELRRACTDLSDRFRQAGTGQGHPPSNPRA
ncbi:WYL domain-containing protein [Nakamurella sp. YIM 132087]|uniref:WYL domain-containing protein n=1 Tax=Nakamurella alba TaxID=2665158 RepID=A0A7K1FRF7_9ACTN|nr:WYL domain-containing protein [Nakamurella alba]MTD16716.1 WYL domain-containing protein [Nakamurella alba]